MNHSQNVSTKDALNAPQLLDVFRTFGHHYRRHWKLMLLVGAGMLGSVITTLLQPWPLKLILDQLILQEAFPTEFAFLSAWFADDRGSLLLALVLALVLITLLDLAVTYAHRYGLLVISNRMTADIRSETLHQLMHRPLNFHQQAATGDDVYRLTNEVRQLPHILVQAPLGLVERVVMSVSILVALWLLHWPLALVALAVVPVLFWYALRFGKGLKAKVTQTQKQESKVASLAHDNLSLMPLVQAYGQEEAQARQFQRANQKGVQAKISVLRLTKFFRRMNKTLIAIGTAAVVFAGGWLVLDGALLPGTLVVVAAYVQKLYRPMNRMAAGWVSLTKAGVSVQRVMALMAAAQSTSKKSATQDLVVEQGSIEFQDMSFCYPDQPLLFKDFSVKIEAGQQVALVGPSGVGKSTLFNLLLKFHEPQQGKILMDGQDLADCTTASLRHQVVVVFQQARLLNRSVRENIALGRPDADAAAIEQAAKDAQAHEFIPDLPEGYDTEIGEGGHGLSGGQRQRVALARAFLKDAPILVMDEPTTALDNIAAASLQSVLERLTRGKTTLIVAHQQATIERSDLVIFLKRPQEFTVGAHQALLKNDRSYQQFLEGRTGQNQAEQQADAWRQPHIFSLKPGGG